MMAGRSNLLKKIYDRNDKTGSFIVKVSIARYSNIFNDLNASPMRMRDLDQDFICYLEDCSSDLPLKYDIELQLHCDNIPLDSSNEERVRAGIKNYSTLNMVKLKEKIVESYRISTIYFAVFTFLMITAFYLGPKLQSTIITETPLEGISIGGGVFLWETIALLFIKNRKTRRNFRRHERIEKASVSFIHLP